LRGAAWILRNSIEACHDERPPLSGDGIRSNHVNKRTIPRCFAGSAAIALLTVLFGTFVASASSAEGTETAIDPGGRGEIGMDVARSPSCHRDVECVPARCCHPASCVHRSLHPTCRGISCSLECRPGTLDCGQGHCGCRAGSCVAIFQ
jgi:hypothetical protein